MTDHKPLTAILGSKKGIPPLATAQLQRWAWTLSAYKYEIEFRPTDKHCNVGSLSHIILNEILPNDNSLDPGIFDLSQMEALRVTTGHSFPN